LVKYILKCFLRQEKDLMNHFKGKAKVLEGFIKRDADNGFGIGAAVVRFASLSEAEDIINNESGKIILGVYFRIFILIRQIHL